MKRIGKIIMWVVLGIGALTLFGWVTQLLWNWLIPSVFNGPEITYWQTLGLLALTKIFLWGIGGKNHGYRGGHWRNHYRQKLASMSQEERAAFKEKMMNKWCKPASNRSDQ